MKKCFVHGIALLLISCATHTARAELTVPQFLSEVWGTAWTVGNAIVGEVTITPAYAVKDWDYMFRAKWYHPPAGTGINRYKARLSLVTKQYFYTTDCKWPTYSTNHTQPFPVNSVDRFNGTCQFRDPEPDVDESWTCDHNVAVWAASVARTGLFAGDGPWQVYVKTTGNKLTKSSTACFFKPSALMNFWGRAQISETGHQVITIGNPNCALAYPYALAREFY